ncbi:hypothetical protein [Vibrio phage CAU_VPP01]|nr:hypothetical protein [Vibrio phage CAU_VPP01]
MLTIIIQDVHTDTMDIYPVDNTVSIISEYDEHFTQFLTKTQRPEDYYSLLAYKDEVRPIKRCESIRIYQGGELLDSVEFVERKEKPDHLKATQNLTTNDTAPAHSRPDYSKDANVVPDVAEPTRAPNSEGKPKLHDTLAECRAWLGTCQNRLDSFMAYFEADTTVGVHKLGESEFYQHRLVVVNKEAARKVKYALIATNNEVPNEDIVADRISEAVSAINDYNQELYRAMINRDKWEADNNAQVFECVTPTTYKQMRSDVHGLANRIILV